LPEIEDNTPNIPTSRCIGIITEARSLWGINPFFHVTDTSWPEAEDLPPENPPEISPLILPETSLKECSKYPDWKLKSARTTARACYSVQNYLYRYSPYGHDVTPDIAWKEAIDIVRSESIPQLDQRITDSMILSILAIERAWSILGDVLYYREKEDSSGILKQVLIAGQLLAKAGGIVSETVIKAQEETIKNQEKTIRRTTPVGIFRKRDNHWFLSFNEKTIRLKAKGIKGLCEIHYLLRHPGKNISVYEMLSKEKFDPSNSKENPVVDDKSIEELKGALISLQGQYEGARWAQDESTFKEKSLLEDKIEEIENELKKTKGRGRRIRQFSDTEKHRKTIWKRIKDALDKLKTRHSPLFDHLSKTITTGNECSYRPGNDPLLQYEDPNWEL
jgi:hypothetical protein